MRRARLRAGAALDAEGRTGRAVLRRPGLAPRRAPRVAPVGGARDGRLREGARVRVLLGAFGDPGHAFPMIALGSELVARGHDVGIETWQRWREPREAAGMVFAAAPEYQVFPTRERPLKPYEAAVLAAQDDARVRARRSRPTSRSRTSSPRARAGRGARGRARGDARSPTSTPTSRRAAAVLDRRPAAAHAARRARCGADGPRWWRSGSSRAAGSTTTAGRGSGSPPLPYVHTGLSRSLTMVGDAAAARVPARVAGVVRVVGPLLWEPGGPRSTPPPGDGPVVLVAPSTSQDPSDSLLRAVPGRAWRTSRCG